MILIFLNTLVVFINDKGKPQTELYFYIFHFFYFFRTLFLAH